ncbi:TonB-dependent receptor plug domain-containing protein [Sporomusa sphaeroides]|uniref:Vitamin B12 transporter BtuB n=1 Tax=Sporomusa sphaeroides DSM 2875 TaxID=1337886 RepID=A0ABP2CAR6_9FIRM|nr:TonB-dependent receptor [Sporomusa sphaeroides]CVK21047.1 Vitamin B12 transporter BtuB precursor [Sporomusa sphaeroides DSM 2875]
MRFSKKVLAAAAVAGMMFAGTPAIAQEIPTFSLEEIIIQADGAQTDNADTTVSVKTVSPGKASSIPELLRGSAGIDIQQRAGVGDNQDGTVKLRGFDARRYTVLLNGRQINVAGVMGGQYVDWTTIPLNTVEKIQIIKGGKSAAHGNTLGGVINIITRDKGINGGEINILSGSNGRYDYLFNYTGSAGPLNFNIIANKTGSDGFLRNNDYDAKQYGLRLNYDITPSDNIAVGLNRTETKRGFIVANRPGAGAGYDPGFPISDGKSMSPPQPITATTPNPGSFWEKDNTYYDLAYKHSTETGFWRIDYWKNDEKRREVNYNTAGQIILDRSLVSDESDSFGFSGQETNNGHTIGYGGEYKRLRYGYGAFAVRPPGAGDIYPSQKIDLWGAYIDDTFKLNDRWSAYLGLRYDHLSAKKDDAGATAMRDYDTDALSPKLSLSFKNNEHTTTFLSVNRLWRAPSMAEYYWWSNQYNSAVASPGYRKQLKPEQGYSYEIGAEQKVSEKYNTKLTLYHQDINDYINFQHVNPFWCYNIDKVKVWGAEWENSYKFDDSNRIVLNYTNQHTKKVGTNNTNAGLAEEFDFRPRHKVSLGYQYDAKPWQLRYNINFVSSQQGLYNNNNSRGEIGGYTTHNLAVVRELDKSRTISLYVDNIFDKQYVEQIGYPMPGRSYYVSLTQKI